MARRISHFQFTTVPLDPNDPGADGHAAIDNEYLYIYTERRWKRTALSQVQSNQLSRTIRSASVEKFTTHDESYFYLFFNRAWKTLAISLINLSKKITHPHGDYDFFVNARLVPPPTTREAWGQDGYLAYDKEYFYIFIQKEWHKTALSDFASGQLNTSPLQRP